MSTLHLSTCSRARRPNMTMISNFGENIGAPFVCAPFTPFVCAPFRPLFVKLTPSPVRSAQPLEIRAALQSFPNRTFRIMDERAPNDFHPQPLRIVEALPKQPVNVDEQKIANKNRRPFRIRRRDFVQRAFLTDHKNRRNFANEITLKKLKLNKN